jgi:hypothetical protein
MPNPTFVKFAGEMELFSQEVEHEEFLYLTLRTLNLEVTSQCFQASGSKEIHMIRNIEGVPFFCSDFFLATK